MTQSSFSQTRPSIDVFALAGVVGAALGLADALVLYYFAATTGPDRAIPLTYWISIPLTWITFCVLIALLFSMKPLRRFAVAALTFSAVAAFLISRIAPLFYRAYLLSVKTVTAVALLASALATIACSRFVARRYRIAAVHGVGFRKWAITALLLVSCACILIPKTRGGPITIGVSPRMNVVLVFLDTVREDDSRGMPALERFANESIVFGNAWAPAPWTIPSHISVLTGRDAWQPGGATTAIPADVPTLAQKLASLGYSTAAIFGNPILRPESGITKGYEQLTFSNSSGVALSGIGFLLSRSHLYGGPRFPLFAWMSAAEVNEEAVRVIGSSRRPYFLTLNYIDAHSPYYVPRDCKDAEQVQHSAEDMRIFRRGVASRIVLPASVAEKLHADYRGTLRCMDRAVDALLKQIAVQHDADRTIIVFVGDHGEQFGEHGFTLHGNSIYRPVLHVPLILHIPGIRPTRVADPVSITDLHDTLLRAAMNGVRSPSAWPLFNDSLRRPVISEFNMGSEHAVGITDSTYHLLHWDDGKEEWYAYNADPAESKALPPPGTPVAAELRHRLTQQVDQRTGRSKPFRALGYIQ